MQRAALAERCFAEPGSHEAPRSVRPRLCSAPLREVRSLCSGRAKREPECAALRFRAMDRNESSRHFVEPRCAARERGLMLVYIQILRFFAALAVVAFHALGLAPKGFEVP